MLDNLYKFVVPAVAGPARLVPLPALATAELSANALRVAAMRGRLKAAKAADGSWRSSFQIHPSQEDVELRAFLHGGGRAASETLAYLWQPGKEVAAR